MKTRDALSRSDRVLVGAMALVLATASAALGASLNTHPHTDNIRVVEKPVVKLVTVPVAPPQAAVRTAGSNAVLARLLQEHKCLAEVMYFEARGEGEDGQKAVAEVVFHRMNTGAYGHSICAVVYEGVASGACQFSFACDGARDAKHEPGPWHEAEALAARIMAGEEQLENTTGGAVAFHTSAVAPDWSGYERTVQIGNHIFYRRLGHSSGA